MQELEFRKLKDYRTRGPYPFKGILSIIETDGAIILDILEIWFYYKPFKIVYAQNFWTDLGDAMRLYRSRPEQVIWWEGITE